MRIDGSSPLSGVVSPRPVTGAPQTERFAPASTPAPTEAATRAVLAAPATNIAMLVALASIDPAVERRRTQSRRASRALDLLEGLRDQLEAGMVTPEQLNDLAAWADTAEVPNDSVLADITRDIELRVRVELAKREAEA